MSEKSISGSLFARREFLKLSAVAVGGVAGTAFPMQAFGALRELPKALLSAGYSATEPAEGEITWLMPADRLLTGDAEFLSRDARVSIRSSARAASQAGTVGDASIEVVYPVLGYQPDSYPTYRAWSWRGDTHLQSASAAVSFRVPIEATRGLQLVLSTSETLTHDQEAGTQKATGDRMLTLAFDSSKGPKLQRGIYVVAYSEQGRTLLPNWSVVPISRRGNDIIVPDAKFSYFVLSIDYAS
jgi:hypothetical protein